MGGLRIIQFILSIASTHHRVVPVLGTAEELGVWQGVERRQSAAIILHTVQHLSQGREEVLAFFLSSVLALRWERQIKIHKDSQCE